MMAVREQELADDDDDDDGGPCTGSTGGAMPRIAE